MKTILTLTFFILCFSVEAQNIISNSGFEEEKGLWVLGKYNGATGRFSINEKSSLVKTKNAHIQIDNPSELKTDLRLFQTIELKPETSYEISLLAETDSSQELSVDISSDLEEYWSQDITINKEQKTYGPFIFESGDPEMFSFFSINLGKVKGTVKIDSVILNELKPEELKELELASRSKEFNHSYGDNQLSLIINNPVENYGLLSLSDFSGRTLYAKDLVINESEIYIDPIQPGLYLLEMTIDDKYFSQKLLLR